MGCRKLILRCFLSPGDIATMTAAVESLHLRYPGAFLTDVRTSVPELWEHNPRITPIADGEGESISMEYPSIHSSDQRPISFLGGYARFLGEKLNWPLEAMIKKPMIYLSDEEKQWQNQIHGTVGKDVPFWIVNAGIKRDFTAKQWPIESYQEVVNATRGRIQWVQIGEAGHDHEKLDGVIDLRGKTTTRQLIRLCHHARGGIGPVTFLQHLMAAFDKTYLCLLGGREPLPWVQYPLQHTFHSLGLLPCCREKACWKSRVVPLRDGDSNDNSLCEMPILGGKRPVAKCMAIIRPSEVVATLERILSA